MDNEKDLSPVNAVNDGRSKMERFEDWLTNTFWFHYKWYFLVGIFVVSLLVMSAVGIASAVTYDWTVVYAHEGPADAERAGEIQKLMEDLLPETGKNRRVDVEVIELANDGGVMADYGEQRLYSHLNDQDIMLFVLDEENYRGFEKLGFFDEAAAMVDMPGLFCAVHDSPVDKLSSEDPRYSDYSQEFLDEVYLEYVAEHEGYLEAVREVLRKVS